MRGLIVDDELPLLEIFHTILKKPGVEIDKAKNCSEAYNLLAKNTYDWVTLDLSLPDGKGIDILKEIHAEHPGTHVIVISWDVDIPGLRAKLLSLGAQAAFSKPFPIHELLECIYGKT